MTVRIDGADLNLESIAKSGSSKLYGDVALIQSTGVNIAQSGQNVTFTTDDSAIDHDSLSNFAANEHIDWTSSPASKTISLADDQDLAWSSGAKIERVAGEIVLTPESGKSVRIKENWDGWIDPNETWTYASATTFTIPGDVTAKYVAGTKIKLTQTTAKYFYVVAKAYSDPDTTITVAAGSSYSLANAAITNPLYSYAVNPQAFTQWFNWTPVHTGFSADPTNVVARFKIVGKTVFVMYRAGTAGTSNAATHQISLPVTAATITNAGWGGANNFAVDNSSLLTTASRWNIASAATVVVFYPQMDSTEDWVTSGGKRAAFEGFYEF